ncbi:MAG: peptidoglycan DD-metalloendopeptidase family protein [Spirochaetaceae bacterium]
MSRTRLRAVAALDRLWHRCAPHVTGMDVAVVAAAVGALFALNVILAPSHAFSRVVTRPGDLSLPGPHNREDVLNAYLDPPNQYDVIGGAGEIDTSRFESVEVEQYELQPGDTLLGLALRHDLNMDTIVSFNQIEDVRLMRVGEVYEIPDRDGILYTVKQGDALSSIARRYGVGMNAILDANDMTSSSITPGETVFVPQARMNESELKLILGELFLQPMRGILSSGYGMRNDPFTGIRRMHYGIDVVSEMGAPVKAARAGRVAHIDTQLGNYGKFVILRHPGGYQTLYAHLDSFDVSVGQYVSQGQVIGRMGNTGRSTGPHLHFSIIRNGAFVDPMEYLH